MSLPPITINNDSKYYPDQVARMMREYGAACRAAALEEAARVCDDNARKPSSLWEEPGCWAHANGISAAAIRALKEKP